MNDAGEAVTEQKPRFDEHGVPLCTEDGCPSYDGKRCMVMGFRPDRICEPEVIDMAAELVKLRGA